MLRTTETLCVVPERWWRAESATGADCIAEYVADALATEIRVGKGANLATDEGRYSTLCQRIEDSVRVAAVMADSVEQAHSVLQSGRPASIALADGLLGRLGPGGSILELPSDARIGKSFVPPDCVASHALGLRSLAETLNDASGLALRFRLTELAVASKAGLVECLDPFNRTNVQTGPIATQAEDDGQLHAPIEICMEPNAVQADSEWPTNWADEFQRALDSVDNGLRTGRGFNPSNWANMITTEVLRRFAYAGSVAGSYARVVYADGSEGAPFPVGHLGRPAPPVDAGCLELSAALLSMRHPELDAIVDFNWYRNSLVSKTRTFAETDEYCHRVSAERLKGLPSGPVRLHVYQTGFPPALIGLYRALAEYFVDNRGRLIVIPKYWKGDAYVDGMPWF